MPVEAILAPVAFVAMFAMWVVLPSRIARRRDSKAEEWRSKAEE